MIVTLYTKADCSLCDEIKADLQTLQSAIGFNFDECDIETDPKLFEKYRYLIPVVDIEGGPMFYAPIYLQELRQALESAKDSQNRSSPL